MTEKPIDKARILAIHQSDPACLARYKAERIDRVESTNAAAQVGSACHRACEALAYVSDDDGQTPESLAAVARKAVWDAANALSMSAAATERALAIMERALAPESRLKFATPTGWRRAAEVRWALDAKFEPCDPDSPTRLAAGTIDLLEWSEETHAVRITDEKTTLGFQGHDDIYHAWQPRMYALWAIQNYDVPRVTFRYRNLFHGYAVQEPMERIGAWFEATKDRIRLLRTEREAAFEMDTWPETMGPDCDYCPIIHRCEAQKKAARDGRVIAPDMDAAEKARRAIGLKAMSSAYERAIEAELEKSKAPIDIGHGRAFGWKPTTVYKLTEKYQNDDGTITPEQREKLMVFLRGYRMTPEQEQEWFLFCPQHLMAGKVRAALTELLQRDATAFLADTSLSPVVPATRFEASAWLPTTGKRVPAKDIDAILDEIDW